MKDISKHLIRFTTLFIGFVFALYIIFINYESADLLLLQFAMMFLWVLLPFYAFFILSIKFKTYPYLILPPVFILIPYGLFAYDYLSSTSSTSALVFLVAPVYGLVSLGIGYLLAWIWTKLTQKKF